MSQDLYRYYERELSLFKSLAKSFKEQYPATASRLMLEGGGSTDPHIERMIEGFALLAGRVHHKLDDDFPELTDALLNVLYPHYLAPVPSCAVMQFVGDPVRMPPLAGFDIPRGSKLFTPPVDNLPCRYRTAYDVTLWPLTVASARLQSPPFPAGTRPPPGTTAILRLSLQCEAGASFDKLPIRSLRFHLAGEPQIAAGVYELLLNHVLRAEAIDATAPNRPVPLPAPPFAAVGFEDREALLPYPSTSFPGYRLLTEFFAFPAKFWFLDLLELDRLAAAGFGSNVDVICYLRRTTPNLEAGVNAATFRLGCAPIVNLFEHVCEPVPLTMASTEYLVKPDVAHPHGFEVYSIDEVAGVDPAADVNTTYRPFYSVDHHRGRGSPEAYWYAARRTAVKARSGKGKAREEERSTDVFLQLVDRSWNPTMPAVSTLVVGATCTNRNLPLALIRAGDALTMTLEAAAPLTAIRCVRTPTAPLRPPRRKGAHWRLLSHLALNHLSIGEGDEARVALQEILRLYDFSDPAIGQQLADVNRLLVDGLVGLSSNRVVGRVDDPVASGFCRGTQISVALDEEKYAGVGAFLFASVLERFVALYATINSFTQLVATSGDGASAIKAWPPRAGSKVLV